MSHDQHSAQPSRDQPHVSRMSPEQIKQYERNLRLRTTDSIDAALTAAYDAGYWSGFTRGYEEAKGETSRD